MLKIALKNCVSYTATYMQKMHKKALKDKKNPFGKKGDFVTAPNISDIFSEIIGIWIISTWEKLKKPRRINLVELGPGDGSMAKILIRTFKRFPEFYSLDYICSNEQFLILSSVM